MTNIDKYPYTSALKDVSPELKLLFGTSALVACVCSKQIACYIFVFAFMTFMTVFKAKIPLFYYSRLLMIPLTFLVLCVIGIVINISNSTPDSEIIFCFTVRNIYVFATANSIALAVSLLLKSFAAVSCLYFIILTTAMRDIIIILSLLKCPVIIINLLTLIYQFIFLLADTAIIKMKSQQCRQGFKNPKRYFKNIGMLWASVFVQSFLRSELVYNAMLVRGYDGSMRFFPKHIQISVKQRVMVGIFLTFIVILNII